MDLKVPADQPRPVLRPIPSHLLGLSLRPDRLLPRGQEFLEGQLLLLVRWHRSALPGPQLPPVPLRRRLRSRPQGPLRLLVLGSLYRP